MRVVHHHYSSGIDQGSDERERERERKRTREDEKERFFLEMKKKRNWTLSNNTQTLCFDLSKYGVKQELFNRCVPFHGRVYMQVCGGMRCAIYHIHYSCLCLLSFLSRYTILEKNASVSCMDLFFNPGRWRHICQSGCEDGIYCLVASAQDEGCEDDGTQGRPTLPEGTFAEARKEEGAPHVAVTTAGCKTRKSRASETSYLEKL